MPACSSKFAGCSRPTSACAIAAALVKLAQVQFSEALTVAGRTHEVENLTSQLEVAAATAPDSFEPSDCPADFLEAVKNGKVAVVKDLLATDAGLRACLVTFATVVQGDKATGIALHLAADSGQAGVVQALLDHGVEVNAPTLSGGKFGKSSALFFAASRGHTEVALLLLKRDDIQVNLPNEIGWSALIVATREGHEQIAELLLKRDDIDVNFQKNQGGNTALHWAASKGHKQIADLLLKRDDIDVNLQNRGGYSALIVAAKLGLEQVVESLLKRDDIDVNLKTQYDDSALIWAAFRNHERVVESLLNRDDTDVNLKNRYGTTALIWAAQEGHEQVVLSLLKREDIDVNLQTEDGLTALMAAAQSGLEQVVTSLLAKPGIKIELPDKEHRTALYFAARNCLEKATGFLLDAKGNQNAQDKDGHTPLMAASRGQTSACVKVATILWSSESCNLNLRNKENMTAFMVAAESGSGSVVWNMLRIKAVEVNLQNKEGLTALMLAAKLYHRRVLENLRRSPHVQVDLRNKDGVNALVLAAENSLETAEYFLRVGHEDEETRIKSIVEAYMLAASNGYLQAVKVLGNTSAEVAEACTEDGDNALMRAVFGGQLEVARVLLDDFDLDPNLRNKANWTLLHYAVNAKRKRKKLVQFVLDLPSYASPPRLDFITEDNLTALQMAVGAGDLVIVQKLLEKRAAVRHDLQGNRSTLQLAVRQGNYFITKALLDNGASADDIDGTDEEAKRLTVWFGVEFTMMDLVRPFADLRGGEWIENVFWEPPSNCEGDMQGKCFDVLLAHAQTADMVHLLWNWQPCHGLGGKACEEKWLNNRRLALASNLLRAGGDKAALALLARGVGQKLEAEIVNNETMGWQWPSDAKHVGQTMHHVKTWNLLHWSAFSCDSKALTSAYGDGLNLQILKLLAARPLDLDGEGQTPLEVAHANREKCLGVSGVLNSLEELKQTLRLKENLYIFSATTAAVVCTGIYTNRLLFLQQQTLHSRGWCFMLVVPMTLVLTGCGIAFLSYQYKGSLENVRIASIVIGGFAAVVGILLALVASIAFKCEAVAELSHHYKKKGNNRMDRCWEKVECGGSWALTSVLVIQSLMTNGKRLILISGLSNAVASTLPLVMARPRLLAVALRLVPGTSLVAWWVSLRKQSSSEPPAAESMFIAGMCIALAWIEGRGACTAAVEAAGRIVEIELSSKEVGDKFTANKLIFGRADIAAHGIEHALGLTTEAIAEGLRSPIEAMQQEVETAGDKNDRENFKYIVEGTSGNPDDFPSAVVESLRTGKYHGGTMGPNDFDTGHEGKDLQAWMETKEVKLANLTEAEFVAVRFYTSSSFPKISGPLRKKAQAITDGDTEGQAKRHPWAMVVYLMDKGIKKLRSVQAQVDPEAFARQTTLWRGMKNMEVDIARFRKHGGTEMAPMSTTTNEDVARHYAASKVPLVFKYVVGGMKTGVSIRFLSLYPKEEEFLYAPLTFLTLKIQYEDDGTTVLVVEPVMS